MSIKLVLDELTRASPAFIYLHTFFNALIFLSKKYLLLGLFLIGSDIFNFLLKEYVFRTMMGNRYYPILGYGIRPNMKDCGLFRNNTLSKSYGMPSGHSQIICLFITYWILEILKEDGFQTFQIIILIIIALVVMYSRVYWAKCHTIAQVLVGGIIGISLGILFHKKVS